MCEPDNRKVILIEKCKPFPLVLDIACGFNIYKPFFKQHIGLDLKNKKADIIADAHRLPFRDNIFKTIVLFDIIEHSTKYGLIFEEAKRVAKNHAKYLLSTVWVEGDAVEGDTEHKHCYTNELLRRVLVAHGFTPKISRDIDILYSYGYIKK